MSASLRLCFTCSLLSASLACGDDKGTSDSQATATQGTGTDATTTEGTDGTTTEGTDGTTTTGDATTAAPTTAAPTTGDTTTSGTTTTTATTATTGEPGAWAAIYDTIVATNCDCHVAASPGMLAMPDADTAFANLVAVASSEAPAFDRVEPGDPAGSYLLAKLKGTAGDLGGNPTQMPLGAPPLSPDQIAMVEAWIAAGAAP